MCYPWRLLRLLGVSRGRTEAAGRCRFLPSPRSQSSGRVAQQNDLSRAEERRENYNHEARDRCERREGGLQQSGQRGESRSDRLSGASPVLAAARSSQLGVWSCRLPSIKLASSLSRSPPLLLPSTSTCRPPRCSESERVVASVSSLFLSSTRARSLIRLAEQREKRRRGEARRRRRRSSAARGSRCCVGVIAAHSPPSHSRSLAHSALVRLHCRSE